MEFQRREELPLLLLLLLCERRGRGRRCVSEDGDVLEMLGVARARGGCVRVVVCMQRLSALRSGMLLGLVRKDCCRGARRACWWSVGRASRSCRRAALRWSRRMLFMASLLFVVHDVRKRETGKREKNQGLASDKEGQTMSGICTVQYSYYC